jgi:hypothetical protein
MKIGLFDRLVSRAVGRAYEEAVLVSPRASTDHARAPDLSRPEQVITAIVSIGKADETLAATNSGGDFRKGRFVGVAESSVWISAAQWAALGYDLIEGDLLTLVDRADQPKFTVMLPGSSDLGDYSVTITAEE